MDLGLTRKVALVTGASRGLGRATAEALLAEGAFVMAVARDGAELNELASDECAIFPADLLDPSVPRRAVAAAISRFGRLDIVVANTPGPAPHQPLDVEDADFARAFDATFFPGLRLMQAAAVPMMAQKSGRILIVSSTSVKAPKPFLCLSAASRSALWAWAKSAAPTLYASGVTVNALLPGPHDTARARELGVKDRDVGQPKDFGRFVTTMCADSTRFITGTSVVMDGGELTGV